MENFGGQTKSLMVFLKMAYHLKASVLAGFSLSELNKICLLFC